MISPRYKDNEDILFLQISWTVWEGETNHRRHVLSLRISDHHYDINCMHIFPTNQQVHDFNEQKLNEFSDTATITVKSYHQFNV